MLTRIVSCIHATIDLIIESLPIVKKFQVIFRHTRSEFFRDLRCGRPFAPIRLTKIDKASHGCYRTRLESGLGVLWNTKWRH